MCRSPLLLYNYLLINPSWQLHLTLTFLADAICCSFQTVDAVCLLNELIFFFFSSSEDRFMFPNAFNRNKLNGPDLRQGNVSSLVCQRVGRALRWLCIPAGAVTGYTGGKGRPRVSGRAGCSGSKLSSS